MRLIIIDQIVKGVSQLHLGHPLHIACLGIILALQTWYRVGV